MYGFVITVPELANTIEGGGVGLWSTTQRFMADHPVLAALLAMHDGSCMLAACSRLQCNLDIKRQCKLSTPSAGRCRHCWARVPRD